MSSVGSRRTSGTPPAFLIFVSETATGRKSATAAAITTMSAASLRPTTARCISAAVSTDTASMPVPVGGAAVVTRVTLAPRDAASSAMAWPCLPEDRLPMKRTGSMGSRVPPAVTSTCSPSRSCRPVPVPRPASTSETASTMRAGSASLPAPTSPPARRPSSGSTTCTPRARSRAMLSATAGCSHISLCMAGQTTTGARVASSVFVSRSSLSPAGVEAEHPGGGRGDEDKVRPLAQVRVRDRVGLVPEGRPGPLGAEGVEGGPAHEVQRTLGEHRDHVGAGVDEAAAQLHGLVRRDAPGHPEDDPPALEHGGCRRATRRARAWGRPRLPRRPRPPRRPVRGARRRSCRRRSPRTRWTAACGRWS
jgi:hypothetical protein